MEPKVLASPPFSPKISWTHPCVLQQIGVRKTTSEREIQYHLRRKQTKKDFQLSSEIAIAKYL